MIDFHRRFSKSTLSAPNEIRDEQEYKISKYYTFGWGIFCIITAEFATGMGSLIEAVNVLGSLFYGTILGIFLVAFYMKRVCGNAVFIAAIIGEIFIVTAWWFELTAFLWLNVIGCLLVMLLAWILNEVLPNEEKKQTT